MATQSQAALTEGKRGYYSRRNGETIRVVVSKEPYAAGKGEWLDVHALNEKGKPTGKPISIRPSQFLRSAPAA